MFNYAKLRMMLKAFNLQNEDWTPVETKGVVHVKDSYKSIILVQRTTTSCIMICTLLHLLLMYYYFVVYCLYCLLFINFNIYITCLQ